MRDRGLHLARALMLTCAVAAGCAGREPSGGVSSRVASLTTTTFEAEGLTRTSSAIGSSVSSATAASGGAYVQLNPGPGANDWIELTVPGLAAGTYDFVLYF